MRDWSKRRFSTVLAATLLVSNIQPAFAFAAEAEDTGLCEHHVTHENCGYVAAVVGADCKHEHGGGCFAVTCAHVHGDCGYMAAVEGVDCDHQHDSVCGYAEAVAEVPCTCQQEGHTQDCAYAPVIPEAKCSHVHGECSFVEAKSEISCGHDCTQDEACGEKVLNCDHSHDESCGYVAAVEGKACDFVCEVCAAEEADAAAVAEVKALIEALPALEAVQAMSMEEQKAAYEQTQAAYEAYDKLTADQQQEMADPEEVFKPLFEYFNTLIDTDGELGSGTPDGTAPVLNGLTISATAVTAPGKVEVVVDAVDSISGVAGGHVVFECLETEHTLNCSLFNSYYDENAGTEIPYTDGKLHGSIIVDQYNLSGTYKIRVIGLEDKAGNRINMYSRTYNDGVFEPYIPEQYESLQFKVEESTTPDDTVPTLNNLTISTTNVTAPGNIEVIVEASDLVSGVAGGHVVFECLETEHTLNCSLSNYYYDEETGTDIPYTDGKLHGTIKIDQYNLSGIYKIRAIGLEDKAGNRVNMYSRTYNDGFFEPYIPEQYESLQFTVQESATPDNTAPTLNSLTISATNVTAPGNIEVIVEASDFVSGVDGGHVVFECSDTRRELNCSLFDTYYDEEAGTDVPYTDGKLHGTIIIDQYNISGTYKIRAIGLVDNAGNSVNMFSRTYNNGFFEPYIPEQYESLQFTVINVGADITTSTNQSTFVEDVRNAANDAYIVADFSSNSKLPQGAFDGIKGTDKTLDLTSEGVTWRFEGNDITEDTKSIDLSVQITKAESNTSDASQAIQDKLNDNPGYIMKFAENGTLPGKATIQIKVDYAMREYLGSSTGLNVYYYNNQTGELELVAENLSVINDTYVEFSITHCSYYVLTTELSNEPDVKTIACPYTEEITLTESEEDRYYSFTPTVSGVYVASVPWFDGEGDSGSHITIYDGSDAIGENDGFKTDYRVARATLEAGKTYTIYVHATGATTGQKLTFTFAQSTTPTGVDITRETDELFVLPEGSNGFASANLQPINAVGEIKWSCDSTDVIQLRNDTGYSCRFDILKAGTVVVTASCGSYQDTITITIKEPNTLKLGTIVDGKTFVDKGEGFYYYSFTANEAGRYEFVTRNLSAHQIVTDFDFYNEDNETAYDVQCKVNGNVRRDYITLEAGQSCIFHLVAYDECDYTVIVNKAQSCGSSAYWRFDPATGTLTISGTGHLNSFYVDGGRKYYWEEYLSDIKKIIVEDGITRVGLFAFDGCENATEVFLPDSVVEIAYGAFTDCASLETVVLPESVPELYLTFNGCSSLKNVTLPTALTTLSGAFMGCTSLETVSIPDAVSVIGSATFARCAGLKEFTIPKQITEIGPIAFLDCTNLKKVTFEGNAPNIWEAIDNHPDGRGAFAGCTLTAYYPAGNTTWTEAVMKQYGGNITWKPYCPNGHTVVTDKAVEATCTATGLTEGKQCSDCGEVLTAQTTVAAKGHNYVNGYCSRCGTAASTSGGSTGDGGSTNTGNTGTTTRPTTQPSQNGAELSAKELEASADRNASTTIAVDGIRVTFDANAQKAIADQATEDDIYLHYEEIKEAKLNQAQKKAIKDQLSDHKGQKHVLTFSITLISGGKEIHDFKGGTATVKIPFTPNPGTKGNDYKVFFVDSNGELHPMETTYENGYLVVKLTHFSEYVVFHMPEEVTEETTEATETAAVAEVAASEESAVTEVQSIQAVKTSKTNSIGMILWIVIALCIVGIVVIGVTLLRKREKKT